MDEQVAELSTPAIIGTEAIAFHDVNIVFDSTEKVDEFDEATGQIIWRRWVSRTRIAVRHSRKWSDWYHWTENRLSGAPDDHFLKSAWTEL
jgi:outer membrane protein assembly factor BamB